MFQTLLVQPIYNAFVYLAGLMPHNDAGLAIIAITILVRIVLYPIFTAQIRTQMGMAAMQPELESVKERFKDNKEALAREQLALFRKYKVNPLSTVAALAIQLTLMIALYFALFHATLPLVDTGFLYSFVSAPAHIATNFFGLLDLLTPHHVGLALLVGLTQYVAIRLTLKRSPLPQGGGDKAAMMAMQQKMMLYVMPALIAVFSFFFAGAVGLYFLTGNLVSIVQEWIIRRHIA